MKGSMIIGQPQMLSLILSIIFVVACVLTTTTLSNPNPNPNLDPTSNKQGAGGLTLKLIHRDLIYPPSKYEYDRPIAALALSAAGSGSNLPKAKHINQNSYHEKQLVQLVSLGNIFYVDFYIGTPGVRQFAAFDTGSQFLWVQCAGYHTGHRTNNNIYNPHASGSYKQSSCQKPDDKRYCQRVPGTGCDAEKRCEYNVTYVGRSRSKGYIGFETISFSVGSHNQTFVSKVLFGCGMDNNITTPNMDGIFGIGRILELSIIKLTQRRFSFCIGSISDIHSEYNYLALGDQARLEGVGVLYRPVGGLFGVKLDLMRIGATTIQLGLTAIIDSGSTMSYFKRSVYDKIKTAASNIIGQKMRIINSTALCYEPTHIWKGFPNVSIVSDGQMLFDLNMEGMFWKLPRGSQSYCMAILPVPEYGTNILGALAMQYHNVGFNIWTNKAYFKRRSSCNPHTAN